MLNWESPNSSIDHIRTQARDLALSLGSEASGGRAILAVAELADLLADLCFEVSRGD